MLKLLKTRLLSETQKKKPTMEKNEDGLLTIFQKPTVSKERIEIGTGRIRPGRRKHVRKMSDENEKKRSCRDSSLWRELTSQMQHVTAELRSARHSL
jgi:hypothetical protein